MSDEKRQQRARDARAEGAVSAATAADLARTETTLVGYLRRYVGEWIYVEGARMNYVLHLIDVVADPLGLPLALVYDAGARVGDWGEDGPRAKYCISMPASAEVPRVLPWGAVDEVGICPPGWESGATA